MKLFALCFDDHLVIDHCYCCYFGLGTIDYESFSLVIMQSALVLPHPYLEATPMAPGEFDRLENVKVKFIFEGLSHIHTSIDKLAGPRTPDLPNLHSRMGLLGNYLVQVDSR